MKYIRTKDGKIFDISNFEVKREIYENGELKIYEFWTTRFLDRQVIELFTNEILKQVDTIEELFDEFVYELKSGGKFIDEKLVNKFDIYEQIYGAIWTDKGLIYKARMKGILPNGEIDWELL